MFFHCAVVWDEQDRMGSVTSESYRMTRLIFSKSWQLHERKLSVTAKLLVIHPSSRIHGLELKFFSVSLLLCRRCWYAKDLRIQFFGSYYFKSLFCITVTDCHVTSIRSQRTSLRTVVGREIICLRHSSVMIGETKKWRVL